MFFDYPKKRMCDCGFRNGLEILEEMYLERNVMQYTGWEKINAIHFLGAL